MERDSNLPHVPTSPSLSYFGFMFAYITNRHYTKVPIHIIYVYLPN